MARKTKQSWGGDSTWRANQAKADRRSAAKFRSAIRHNIPSYLATDKSFRKTVADDLRKQRAAKRNERGFQRLMKKEQARVNSNVRRGLSPHAPKGSINRKQAANKLRSRRAALGRSNSKSGLPRTAPKGSDIRRKQAAGIRAGRVAGRPVAPAKSSYYKSTDGLSGAPVAVPRTVKAIKALRRSNAKAGLSPDVATVKGAAVRKAKAAELRMVRNANRQAKADWDNNRAKRAAYNSVIHNAPVPKGTPIRISAGDKQAAINKQRMAKQNESLRGQSKAYERDAHRRQAKAKSSDRHGLVSTAKGSPERKIAAANLRAERRVNRMVGNAKAQAAAQDRKAAAGSHIDIGAAQARKKRIIAGIAAQSKVAVGGGKKSADPTGKKGFARYQAKLNSSKRVYGSFPKGKSAKPGSPERKFAAAQLKAARKAGLRGQAARSHVRTAAQRAASIRNLAKARASRMKPGGFRAKRR